MGSQRIAAFFIAIFLIAHAKADTCTAGCHGSSPPKGGFLEGHTYSYTLDGVATINLSGADNQDTNVKLSAQATVYGLGNCANLLKITALTITGKDGTKYPKPGDIERPVRFTLQDGVLGSEFCSENGDSQKSLNIKRAVISLLQAATKNNVEVDIFGVCPTTFLVNQEGEGQIIHKSRDLNACGHREQGKQDLLTYIYNSGSEVKNSNIMKSDMRSDVAVKNGIVEKVEVHEEYLYRPFSVGPHGVKSNVNTKFVLRNTNKGTLAAQCVVPKSIIFENPHLVNTEHSNVVNIVNALKTATDSMKDHVTETSASKFVALVKALRVSSKDDLKSVYGQIQSGSQIKDNNLAKKVFLDALFRAGTGDSIEFSVTLIQEKQLNPFQEKLVLASLTAVRHASSNSLKAATALLDNENLPLDVYLGVGALAGAYCREHACHGAKSQDAGVATLSAKFAAKLGNCKSGSKKAEDLKVAVLKGIRNIGHIEDSLVDALTHCASDKSVRSRVRVAAFEAFHADPCIPKLVQTATKILKDRQQDSEIRIKAYLALLDCPSKKVADDIASLMENEPVYQVGAFITSSLNNIRASTNPVKQNAKHFFGSIKPKKQYPVNVAKYSQNYELSYEMNSAGIGSAVEGNVIFSQDSYLPRSANFNLTTEIFGRQINLFELGVRQGNLDRVIEQYFGPHSELKTDTPQQLYSGVKKTIDTILEKLSERTKKYKTKRDVQKQIANIAKKLKTDIQGYSGNLDLDVAVKLFGVESVFLSLGDDHPTSIESLIDKIFDYIDTGVTNARTFAHNVHSNLIFLDMELAYPTSTGITMKLNLEGAITSKLGFGGNFDVKQLINDPKNSKIELKVIPSANVDIIGSLSFDADSVVHGLKTVMSLQTSTGSHVVFKTNENGFDMQIGLPVEKQELLTASSNIFFFKREKGAQDIDNKCKFERQNWSPFQTGCFDQLSKVVGLTLCADMSIPKTWDNENKNKLLEQPLFPLSGNALLSVRLEKENLNAYHIKGNHVHKDGLTTTDLDVIVEGPQRSNNIGLKFETMKSDKLNSVRAKLDSNIAKMEAFLAVKTSEEEYSLDTGYYFDDDKYTFKVGVIRPDKNTYKPVLDYKFGASHEKPITVDGLVKISSAGSGKKFTMDNVALNVGKEKFAVTGYVAHAPKPFLWDMDLKVNNQEKFGSLKSKLETSDESTKGFFELHNSLNPVADVRIDVSNIRKGTENKLDFSLVHGEDSQSTVNKITLTSLVKGTASPPDYALKSKLTYPLHGFTAKFETEVNAKTFDLEIEGEYQKKKAELEVELKKQMKKDGDFYGKLKAKVANQGFEIESKYEEETKTKGNFYGKVDAKPAGKYEISGTVVHKNEVDDKEYGVVATIKRPGKAEDYKIDINSATNPNSCTHHTKVSVGAVNYVDVAAEVKQHPKSGTLKIILKDAVNAQGQFKINPDNKGNGLFIVDFTKWDRKVKLETNFLFLSPTYNFNLDLYPNVDKEANQKITFNTANTVKDENVNSKNFLAINGQKTELNFNTENTGVMENGKNKADVEIKCHEGKTLTFTVSREASTKNDNIKASMDVSGVYVSAKGAAPSKASWKARLINMNKVTKQFEAEHQLNVVSSEGKDLDLKLALKRTPKNERATADIKFDASGSMCDHHANLFMTFDYYDGPNDKKEDINYRIKGTHGDKSSLELTGAFLIEADDTKDGQFKNDFELHVIFPTDKPYEIRVNSKDLLNIPHATDKFFDLTTTKAAQINGQWYKLDGSAKFNENNGNLKLSTHVPEHNKIVFDSSYKVDKLEDESVKYYHTVALDYGENKHLKVVVDSHRKPGQEGQLNINADLEGDNNERRKIVTNINYKVPADRTMIGDMKVDIDGKKYALSSNVNMADKHDSTIEFKASYPDGKPARVFIHAWKSADIQYKGESKFENIGDFNLDMTVDAKLQAPETFDVKVFINSEKLKLNKVNFQASTDASKGKKIQFSATENGQNVLSGTTTFQSRQEGNKYIMEGSGNVKIKNEEKTTSFKYIRDKLKEETEKGYEVFFNVALGEKKIVIEHKITNKEYKLSSVYCEEKKQCANIDINNKLDTSAAKSVHHMKFNFDLRKLGFAPEFGLSTTSELERFKLPVHNMDIHMSQDKFKYHVQVYAKPDPKKKSYQTAMIWTTPNRIVSLESSTSIPESSKTIFPLQHETVFFFNKNDPNTKTLFRVSQDHKREEHKFVTSTSEILFTSPALGKDLQISTKSHYDAKTHEVSYDAVFDIFKKKSQKVVASFKFHPQIVKDDDIWKSKIMYDMQLHIDGKALGYDIAGDQKFSLSAEGLVAHSHVGATLDQQKRDFSLDLNINKHGQSFMLKSPQGELINYQCHCHHGDKSHKMDATLSILQEKTYIINTEVTWSPIYKISVSEKAKDQPGELHFFASVKPLKKLEVGVEYKNGKAAEPLVHFLVDSEKSPKPQWTFNSKNIKPVVEKVTQNLNSLIAKASKTLKEAGETTTKDFAKLNEISQAAAPEFRNFINTYKQELEKMSNELKADKSLANFADSIGKVFLAVNKVVIDVTHKYLEIVGQMNEALMETFQKLVDIWTSKILPELTTLAEKISQAFLTVAGAALELVSNYIVYLSDFLDKHSAEFKPIMDDVAKILKNVWTGLEGSLVDIREQIVAFVETAKKEIAEYPLVQMLNEKLEEHDIPNTFLQIVTELCNQLKALTTSEEFKAFLDSIQSYIEKKVMKKPVDDLEELTAIYKKAISAYDSIATKEEINLPTIAVPDYSFFASLESKLPSLTPPEFSVVNHLFNGNIPDPIALLKAYRPRSLLATDLVPPYKLQAIIAGGQHIFTYDGRHMTFPGTCQYVLSHDAVDGNFSIILNMDKGAAKSITLWDKSGTEVEVDAHSVLLNGQKHGFPVVTSSVQAFKYGDRFEINSKYGAHVSCSNSLDICYIEVSGFYFGKLRGLLGDGNNEPFDDFRMPNGKISSALAEFGTAYSTTTCPAPKVMDHAFHEGHGHKTEGGICNDVFGKDSPLRVGDIAVDIKNFKQACEHAVAKGEPNVKDEVCLIARAYQIACRKSALFLTMPDICGQCTMDGKTLEPEQTETFKLPQKQADIILAVETTKSNEKAFKELVTPLMSAVVDGLKAKKITDIQVTLVGLSTKFNRPLEYDVENSKLKGNKMTFTDEERSHKWESPVVTENEKFDKALDNIAHIAQELAKQLGVDNFQVSHLRLVVESNWRPKAVKTFIVVHSEPYVSNPILQVLSDMRGKLMLQNAGVTAHLFAPLAGLTAKGAKENSVIGFSEDNVYVLGDKKRGLSHPDLRSSIQYEEDSSVHRISQTHGSAFSTKTFFALGNGERKNYVTLASQAIVDSLVEVESDVLCTCRRDIFTLQPKVTCTISNRKDKRLTSSKK